MDKIDIIKKIAAIDAELSSNRFDHHLTPEKAAKLNNRRNNLERKLYK